MRDPCTCSPDVSPCPACQAAAQRQRDTTATLATLRRSGITGAQAQAFLARHRHRRARKAESTDWRDPYLQPRRLRANATLVCVSCGYEAPILRLPHVCPRCRCGYLYGS